MAIVLCRAGSHPAADWQSACRSVHLSGASPRAAKRVANPPQAASLPYDTTGALA